MSFFSQHRGSLKKAFAYTSASFALSSMKAACWQYTAKSNVFHSTHALLNRQNQNPILSSVAKEDLTHEPGAKKPFSIEEALFLAKEGGIATTKEKQMIIIKSPPFSPDKSPFLLENIFSTIEDNEKFSINIPVEVTQDETDAAPIQNEEQAPWAIHSSIVENFNREWKHTFWHNGKEWLVQSEGRGTNKRAAAHVIIRRGSGQVRVNKDEDIYAHWPYYYNRMDILEPFLLTQTAGVFDLFIRTRGGGVSGQSRAVRLAVGNALVRACPSCKDILDKEFVLYEDKRQKMPKMPGRRGARRMKAWSKR